MNMLISFGYKHGTSPLTGHNVIDIREEFGRNPYHDKALRPLRGDHPDVIEDILKTPDFEAKLLKLKARVRNIAMGCKSTIIYIGCTGGHHRSVYIVNRLAKELGWRGMHRDYFRNSSKH